MFVFFLNGKFGSCQFEACQLNTLEHFGKVMILVKIWLVSLVYVFIGGYWCYSLKDLFFHGVLGV